MEHRVLIIDDDPDFVALLEKYLRSKGLDVITAGTAQAGMELIKNSEPDVALIDVKLPDRLGVELVGMVKSINQNIPVIMVSGYGEPKLVVGAMKAGATDYVLKPVNHSELLQKISEALEIHRDINLERELGGNGLIIGNSVQNKKLIHEISKIANSDAPVLLRGESGTGKTLVAEIIHAHSPRKDKPFVIINCPAIPEHLLESELFGHERGAFTGAVRDKIGKFKLAEGGTVFLDEIGDLSPDLQAKILRVLQGHEFERVGGLKTIKVDVRIIAATNRNLEQAIQENRFREDLFYRLNVLPLYIPSLRERKEDLSSLAEHFLQYYSRKSNKRFNKIPEAVMNRLMDYDWPGNIRELQNVIERAVVLGKGPHLHLSDFTISKASPRPSVKDVQAITSLKDLEHQALIRALEQSGGNISKAARILGVGRDTIYRRLRKHKIALS